MKFSFFSRKTALIFSALAFISELWRSYLDAMFVLPVDFGDRSTLHIAALIFTLIFVAWGALLYWTRLGSRLALAGLFGLNLLILLATPVSWLLFYCPAECRANAGFIFNLVNSLNLVFGILAAVALGFQFLRQRAPETG